MNFALGGAGAKEVPSAERQPGRETQAVVKGVDGGKEGGEADAEQ